MRTLLLSVLASACALCSLHAQSNDFKPLPKIGLPQSDRVYIASDPKRTRFVGEGPTPGYAVFNGRVMPFTNAPATSHTNSLQRLPKDDGVMSIPPEQRKQFQDAYLALDKLRQSDPARIARLHKLIAEANMQPEIQNKLKEVSRAVHDYVLKKSPADIEAFEIMRHPKDIMEHNKQPSNMVY